jgi:hypothetical protein
VSDEGSDSGKSEGTRVTKPRPHSLATPAPRISSDAEDDHCASPPPYGPLAPPMLPPRPAGNAKRSAQHMATAKPNAPATAAAGKSTQSSTAATGAAVGASSAAGLSGSRTAKGSAAPDANSLGVTPAGLVDHLAAASELMQLLQHELESKLVDPLSLAAAAGNQGGELVQKQQGGSGSRSATRSNSASRSKAARMQAGSTQAVAGDQFGPCLNGPSFPGAGAALTSTFISGTPSTSGHNNSGAAGGSTGSRYITSPLPPGYSSADALESAKLLPPQVQEALQQIRDFAPDPRWADALTRHLVLHLDKVKADLPRMQRLTATPQGAALVQAEAWKLWSNSATEAAPAPLPSTVNRGKMPNLPPQPTSARGGSKANKKAGASNTGSSSNASGGASTPAAASGNGGPAGKPLGMPFGLPALGASPTPDAPLPPGTPPMPYVFGSQGNVPQDAGASAMQRPVVFNPSMLTPQQQQGAVMQAPGAGIPHAQGGTHSAPRPAPLQLNHLPNFPAITDPRTAAAFQSAFAALREGVSALQPVCDALGPGAGGTRFQTIIDGLDTLGCTPLHAAAAGGQSQVSLDPSCRLCWSQVKPLTWQCVMWRMLGMQCFDSILIQPFLVALK